jgi:hypothetical protein
MKPCSSLCIFSAISLMALRSATGQNLNFEDATVPPTPVGGWGLTVSAEDAFPGWTVDFSPAANNPSGSFVILYNNLTLGTPAVDLIGPEFPNALGLMPLEGNYSAVLQSFVYGGPPYGGTMSLSCGVSVPSDARSVTLLVGGNQAVAHLALSGVNIPLVSIGGGRVAGDVTAAL